MYIIKKIVVQDAKRNYRAVDYNLMIDITEYTTVEVVTKVPQSIPEYVYKITPLPAIKPTRLVFNLTGKMHEHTLFSAHSNVIHCTMCLR